MVLGWSNGENIVIKGILDRIAKLESKVKLLESENETQKEEISRLRNNLNNSNISNNSNVGTEWRDIVIAKKQKVNGESNQYFKCTWGGAKGKTISRRKRGTFWSP
jgi:hypothetical protein